MFFNKRYNSIEYREVQQHRVQGGAASQEARNTRYRNVLQQKVQQHMIQRGAATQVCREAQHHRRRATKGTGRSNFLPHPVTVY